MKIFHTPDHLLHAPQAELHRGQMVSPHENPSRMELLIAGLERANIMRESFLTPGEFGLAPILAVHRRDYIEFLKTAWSRWKAAGYAGDVLPMSYPVHPRRDKPPIDVDGAAGFYSSSSDTVVTETSWQALTSIANCAVSAAHETVMGGSAFALIRPPGHHAGAAYMSGYCHLNSAAIAAQYIRDQGVERVAILDVDFHHGNGTQDIFYAREDVFFASIHGHPDHHFPYFWGHEDEIGVGVGEGFTANYPLMPGTDYDGWVQALELALNKIQDFGAGALVISLGVDTFEHDPISSFRLTTPDFVDYGKRIAGLGLPTTIIMEGGYGVPAIGDNTANVIAEFK